MNNPMVYSIMNILVCESLMLCNSIIDFMKFILTQPIDDVYTIKLIGNLFGLVYLHEQIFDI